MNRRIALKCVLSSAALPAIAAETRPLPRVRRESLRIRFRRLAVPRVVDGRTLWVVPVGLAPGWELIMGGRVATVLETRRVKIANRDIEQARVTETFVSSSMVDILREDTPENTAHIAGSVIDPRDLTTPGIEVPARGP